MCIKIGSCVFKHANVGIYFKLSSVLWCWGASLNEVSRNMVKESKSCCFNPVRDGNVIWWSDLQADCVVSLSELLSLKSDQRWELLKDSCFRSGNSSLTKQEKTAITLT